MGALAGIMEAQYDILRKHGHSPSEAFNETVEELTESLIRLVSENGMDWMYANCSATAQRGALDWRPKFKAATLPVFEDLYKKVRSGEECVRVLQSTGAANYKEVLDGELKELGALHSFTSGIQTFFFHRSFPVDIRHNAKIFREKLAVHAAKIMRQKKK